MIIVIDHTTDVQSLRTKIANHPEFSSPVVVTLNSPYDYELSSILHNLKPRLVVEATSLVQEEDLLSLDVQIEMQSSTPSLYIENCRFARLRYIASRAAEVFQDKVFIDNNVRSLLNVKPPPFLNKRSQFSKYSRLIRRGSKADQYVIVTTDGSPLARFSGDPDRISRRFRRAGLTPLTPSMSDYRKYPYVGTVHTPIASFRGTDLVQDGFLPSNYSGGYMRLYLENYTLIPSNPRSAKWASSQGIKIRTQKWICDPLFREPAKPPSAITTLLVALNHTGYWSPLIDSGDTDRMIKWTLAVARNNPDSLFRIRFHPSMKHFLHEGPDSELRHRRAITNANLHNVSVSGGSLDTDIAWASQIASEYSDVLIQGWAAGKLGFSIRPTYRRHFMTEFSDMNFPEVPVTSIELPSADLLFDKQTRAVYNYNQDLEQWASN